MAEGAQGFTVLQGRIQVTVLFDGSTQKTVTVFIYPSMRKVWNVFVLGRVLGAFVILCMSWSYFMLLAKFCGNKLFHNLKPQFALLQSH